MRRTVAFKGVGHAESGPKPLLDQSSERMSAPISPPDGNSCSMLLAELPRLVGVIGPFQRRKRLAAGRSQTRGLASNADMTGHRSFRPRCLCPRSGIMAAPVISYFLA